MQVKNYHAPASRSPCERGIFRKRALLSFIQTADTAIDSAAEPLQHLLQLRILQPELARQLIPESANFGSVAKIPLMSERAPKIFSETIDERFQVASFSG